MPPTIGVWLVVAIISLVAAGTVLMIIYKLATWMPARPMSSRVRSEPLVSAVRANERVEAPEPHTNATEPRADGATNEHEPGDLTLSPSEVIAVQRMIAHNATALEPSKTSTIQAGFGIKRGGGASLPARERTIRCAVRRAFEWPTVYEERWDKGARVIPCLWSLLTRPRPLACIYE